MLIEQDADGTVLSTDSGSGEWYPDDTVLRQETPEGREWPHGPVRISRHQAADWPARAARQWDEITNRWESTGGQTEETDLEKAIRLLRNNPLDPLPDNPSASEVIARVKLHDRYIEGFRQIILKLLVWVGRRWYG